MATHSSDPQQSLGLPGLIAQPENPQFVSQRHLLDRGWKVSDVLKCLTQVPQIPWTADGAGMFRISEVQGFLQRAISDCARNPIDRRPAYAVCSVLLGEQGKHLQLEWREEALLDVSEALLIGNIKRIHRKIVWWFLHPEQWDDPQWVCVYLPAALSFPATHPGFDAAMQLMRLTTRTVLDASDPHTYMPAFSSVLNAAASNLLPGPKAPDALHAFENLFRSAFLDDRVSRIDARLRDALAECLRSSLLGAPLEVRTRLRESLVFPLGADFASSCTGT